MKLTTFVSDRQAVWPIIVLLLLSAILPAVLLPVYAIGSSPSIVSATTTLDTAIYSYQRKMFYASGRHWVFYSNDSHDGGQQDANIQYLYYKTSTDGVTWSDPTQLGTLGAGWDSYGNLGIYGTGFQFSIWFDGIYVHIAKRDTDWRFDTSYHYTEEGEISYRKGSPHTDGSITWATNWQIVVAHALVTLFVPYITVDKDGCPWICGIWRYYTTIPPYSWTRLVYKSSLSNGTWSNAASFPYDLGPDTGSPPSGQLGDYWGVAAAPSNSTSDVLIVYTARGAALKGRIYSGGSMGGEMTISSSAIIYACSFSVIGLDNKYHVAFERPTDYYLMDTYYNGTSWVESTVQSTFYDSAGYRFPVLSFNMTSSPWQVMLLWIELNATYWQIKYKNWVSGTGWDASPSVFCVDNYYGMQYYTLNAFYANYGGKIGAHFVDYAQANLLYSYMNWTGYTEPPPPPPASVIIGFNITNMDAGNWLYAEKKYYDFVTTVNTTDMTYLLEPIDTVQINFTDGAGRTIVACAGVAHNSSIVSTGSDYATTALGNVITLQNAANATITMSVMLRAAIIDRFNVTFYAKLNNTAADETAWTLIASNYCSIYTRSGLYEDLYFNTYTPSGRIEGGDLFNLYAYATPATPGPYVITRAYYSAIQSFHLQVDVLINHWNMTDMDIGCAGGSYMAIVFGMEHYAQGNWSVDYGLNLYLIDAVNDVNHKYFKWQVYFRRQMTWGLELSPAPPNDIFLYTYLEEYNSTAFVSSFWIDTWVTRYNESSVAGIRVATKYYAIENNAPTWQQFLGIGTWGACFTNCTSATKFAEMVNRYTGTVVHGKEIEHSRIYTMFIGTSGTHQYDDTFIEIKNTPVFDMAITTYLLEGIATPPFQDVVSRGVGGGVFGWLIGGLQAIFSQLFAALYPALQYISSAAVSLIDSVLSFAGPHVFSDFIALLTGIGSTVASFILIIPTYLAYVVTMVTNALGWVFSLFTYFWNVIDFLLIHPAFNIFTTIFTIFGIAIAWLAGTTYVNGWGQVYDFSYLYGFSFLGVHGGIVIFMILVPVAFFVLLLSCFAKMSLEPILAPTRLLIGFIDFSIKMLEVMWHVAVWFINILMAAINTIRNMMPRILGTG